MSPSARNIRELESVDSNMTNAPGPLTALPTKSCFKKADSPPQKNHVQFTSLTLREYDVVLGNHPNCSDGPALSIGWCYNVRGPINIDRYEKSMVGNRRTRAQMLIPRSHREYLLTDFGFSRMQIEESIEEIQKIQKERRASYQGSKFANVEKAFSGIRKKMKGLKV